MALGDLFKSKQEREQEEKRKRRKAFREAENAVEAVKDRVKKLKKERDQKWAEARDYLKDGQKGAAQRCLQGVRAGEVMMAKLDMKRWVFEQLLTKLDLAKTDQEFTNALAAINTVVQIDPDKVADVMGEVEDKLGDQVDTDKVWEKMHEKEMEGAETAMTDRVPTLEQMMADLQDEVVGESDTEPEKPGRGVKASDTKAADDDTADLRARARKIIDGGES
jgi:hypothetical protein